MTRRGRRALTFVLSVVVVSLLAMNITLIYLVATDDHGQWDPLGPYPVQTVVRVTDDAVVIEGTKCNDDDEPVRVSGSYSWQRLSPPGFILQGGTGVELKQPGCITQTFENTIPDAVFAADTPGARWRIDGVETPFDGNGSIGVERRFETEVFQIDEQ